MLIILLVVFFTSFAQDLSWDQYDVIDGPNPTLHFVFYNELDGIIKMGRYYFLDNGSELKVRFSTYGKKSTHN